jgi:Na+-transporting methylmalonyl-CoA/oxaloacetate decarboxylase gamma subunit
MIDLAVVARLWSAYGVNIIVLLILLLIVWIIGQVMQRSQVKSKESLKKG